MNCIGRVATCGDGLTGLVLTTRTNGDTVLYRGVCLDSGRVGYKWESRDPKWVGTLDEWVILRALLIEANKKE